MRRIFLNARDFDLKHYKEIFDQYIDSNFEDIKDIHSPYFWEYENSFIQGDDGTYRMNIFDPEMSKVVNKDGILQIGGYLYQYTKSYFKTIKGTTANHLEILKNAVESDEQLELMIDKVEYQELPENTNIKTDVYNWTGGCIEDGYAPFRTRGIINIFSFAVPIYGTVPCSASCPTCFLGQCETIIGYENRTKITAEIYSERKLLGILWWIKTTSGDYGLFVDGTYNTVELGLQTFDWDTQVGDCANVTIYIGDRTNVTNLDMRFATIWNECFVNL